MVVKSEPRELDSFSGYTDETEAGSGTMSSSFAPMVKFSNDHRYVLNDGTELPRDKKYIVAEIKRCVVKWPTERGQQPEKEFLALGERWPDLVARNENTPKDQWVTGPDGKLKGPYEAERQVLLLEEKTMTPYLFVTQTGGGAKAVSDLAYQTELTQKIYGKPVSPVVSLRTTMWSPRFNKLRPDFHVERHVMFSGDGVKPVLQEVERPSLQEELQDKIEY
jgi:hypothetical protein